MSVSPEQRYSERMSTIGQPHTPLSREKASTRLRNLTRGAVLAATGATVAIGIVVSHGHSGSSSTGKSTGTPATVTSGSGSTTAPAVVSGGSSVRVVLDHRRRVPVDCRLVVDPDSERVVAHGHFRGVLHLSRVHITIGRHLGRLLDLGRDLGLMTTTTSQRPLLTKRSFRAIGTTATVVVQDAGAADAAEHMLRADLEAIDLACSRFRDDAELQMVHANAGHPVEVSELLFEALSVAVDAAERTGGAVDPTIGNAIAALGYDADLEEVQARPPAPPARSGPSRATCTCSSTPGPAPCASRVASVSTLARPPRRWRPTGRQPASPRRSGAAPS